MFPDPDALTRLRLEAQSYADNKTTALAQFSAAIEALPEVPRKLIANALRVAYCAGADAGYSVAKAEERR